MPKLHPLHILRAHIAKNKRIFAQICLVSIICSALAAVTVSMAIPILSALLNPDKTVLQPENATEIWQWAEYIIFRVKTSYGLHYAFGLLGSIILGLHLIKNGLELYRVRIIVPFRLQITKDLKEQFYKKCLNASYENISKLKASDLVANITSDITELERSVIVTLEQFLVKPFLITAYIILLFYIQPVLAALSLSALPLFFLWYGKSGKGHSKRITRTQKRLAKLGEILKSTLTNFRTLKVYRQEDRMEQYFNTINDLHFKSKASARSKKLRSEPLTELSTAVLFGISLLAIGFIFQYSLLDLSPERLIAFVVVLSRSLPIMKSIAIALFEFKSGQGILERLSPALQLTPEDTESGTKLTDIETIDFDAVSLSFNHSILCNLHCQFSRGNIYAITGLSGSGKSTMLDCLLGFKTPSAGSISIDGHKLNSLSKKSLRENIRYVNQNAEVIEGSLIHNLSFANQNSKFTDILHVLDIVGLAGSERFISEGAFTSNENGGNNFSGGELQRIAIARALISDAPVLIFDEATNAIDAKTEQKILEHIRQTKRHRLRIVISHRLQTLEYADEILVLHNGAIADKGPIDELKLKKGPFRDIVLPHYH